jgi:uncharacterized protein (TIGR03083 family)
MSQVEIEPANSIQSANPGSAESGEESSRSCDAALARAFKFLGKRWSGVILGTLTNGQAGFAELKRRVDGISDSVLSDRLAELQVAGLVIRSVEPGPPVSVSYVLSEAGAALIPAMYELSAWASENLPDADPALQSEKEPLMSEQMTALHSSVERLRAVVERLDPAEYDLPAYPADWSIADVLSHIGSGAVILRRRFDDIVDGRETDEDFNQSIWDEWSAKTSVAQVADVLTADAALLESLEALDERRRGHFRFSMGPMDFDFAGFVGIRLNEHVLHTWDIEVTLDPTATLPTDATRVVIDNLELIVRFSGKPSGEVCILNVHTFDPSRDFTISLGADSVELAPSDPAGNPDLELPAEAFVRMIYGRLDPNHVPSGVEGHLLDELRRVFPGV